jgi:hypothetical protein
LAAPRDFWTLRYTSGLEDGSLVVMLLFCCYDVVIYVSLVNSLVLFGSNSCAATLYAYLGSTGLPSGYLLCLQLVTFVSCLVL